MDFQFDKSNILLLGPTGTGKTLIVKTIAEMLKVPFTITDATSLTQAGYVGEDVETIIQRLLIGCGNDVKRAETGIVFIDEIDKLAKHPDARQTKDVSGEGVQQGLLKILEGTTVSIQDKNKSFIGANKAPTYYVDTTNILFILSGAFVDLKTINIGFGATYKKQSYNWLQKIEPEDINKFGFIPEFVGRLPIIISTNALDKESLIKILTEPKNAIIKQYIKLFEVYGIELVFTSEAIEQIALKALNENSGARGLRRILENLLVTAMYETPYSDVKSILIDEDGVKDHNKIKYFGDHSINCLNVKEGTS